jgi:Cu2+-exporting ATPase
MATLAPGSLALFTATPRGGLQRLDLHVPGVKCAGCIRKVEAAVRALPGVGLARVNFSTRRLTVEWDDARASAEQILAAVAGAGFEARPFAPEDAVAASAGAESRALVKALAVAGFAMMNIMLLSVSVWSGATGSTRDLFHLVSALIAIPAIAYAGMPFFRSAAQALSRGRTNMDVPISIGVLLATGLSLHETLTSGPHAWFDGVVMLLFFLLAGRVLDSQMRDRARSGIAQLLKSSPRGALVLAADGTAEMRPIDCVAPGMRVLVAAGERLPVDGVVEAGRALIDSSLVTGESSPRAVGPGDRLVAGELDLDGALTLRATAVGEASFLGQMIRMMEAAEGGRGRHVRIADRAARLYAPVVHLLALLTCIGWLLAGAGWHQALVTAIAVLIITCPCALGLAVPAVQVTAAGRLARGGILVKDGGALERLAQVDMVAFDKTGTLTLGRPEPAGALPLGGERLARAAGLAARSQHPLARALLRAAQAEGVAPADPGDVAEVPGQGLTGQGPRGEMRLGRPAFVDPALGQGSGDLPLLAFADGDGPAVILAFDDPLRPDAATAIRACADLGLDVVILSGDRPEAVGAAATRVGVADAIGGMTPADKLAAVSKLAQSGRRVLMVGDGLNDAPALAAGHASMAPATASDVGQTAADLLFMGEGLGAVPEAVRVARLADRVVRQNFALAIGYNLLAVPLAVAGFATPLVAAAAMSTSSILVVANALRLKRA